MNNPAKLRASTATDGLFTDAPGSSYNTYAIDAPRLTPNGLLVENTSANYLLNSNAPVTQTIGLAARSWCLWVIGSGSCTASAGTAVGTGFGTATAGVPPFFTTTVGSTVVFTVSGTLTRFQLELTSFHPTSYIPTAVTVARAADIATAPIGSWCAASPAVTLCFEGIIPWSGAAGIWALWQLDDGTSNNRLGAWLQPGNTAVTMYDAYGSGISDTGIARGAVTPGVTFKLAAAFTARNAATVLNGGTAGAAVPLH